MIDLHSHVLPGIDDGAADETTALAMCRMASEDGVSTLVATPHMYCGAGVTDAAVIRDSAARLKTRLEEEGIEIDLRIGAEVQIVEDLLEKVRSGAVPFYDPRSKYLLLEIPPLRDGLNILREMVFRLRLEGVTPVLAHPERLELFDDLEAVEGLLIQGALMQVTSGSLLASGTPSSRRALEWIRRGWVHAVASDAHDTTRRPPLLSLARCLIESAFGPKAADDLTRALPQIILRGDPLCA